VKSIRVQVEYNDIVNDCHSAKACPIARAINRHGFEAMVTSWTIHVIHRVPMGWGHKRICKHYNTPPLIKDWIISYDRKHGVLPIEFELNLDNPISEKELV
jgi:hypothetical protein